MEGTLQLIQISTADLSSLMEAAVTRALSKAGKANDEQMSTAEAMELTGYASEQYFRKFCKDNGIRPVAVRRRINYYLKADLLKANLKKYSHR